MKKSFTAITLYLNSKFNLIFAIILILSLYNSFAYSQIPTPPLKLGQCVVTSFDMDNNAVVVRVFEIRKNRPAFSTSGTYWNFPQQNSGSQWKRQTMGDVFGITLDYASSPNIFVARSSVYCDDATPLPGLIYRIDGLTWAVSDYVIRNPVAGPPVAGVNSLPNTGPPGADFNKIPGLGNLCYDKWHNQLFVTNFEDGRIYRIKDNGIGTAGLVKSWFPEIADDVTPGFVPRGFRLWGIGVYGTNQSDVRVYYSKWRFDGSNIGTFNEIWSIALDYNGEFINSTNRIEKELPILGYAPYPHNINYNYSNPVSDIEFSFDGAMILGERTMAGDHGPCGSAQNDDFADKARVIEYKRDINGRYLNSTAIIHRLAIDGLPKSAGGVDLGYLNYDSISGINSECDSVLVATGDGLYDAGPGYVYGVQLSKRSSLSSNAIWFDTDKILNQYEDKTKQGDVDVYRKDLCSDTNTCMTIIRDTTYCDSTDTYIYEFQVRNNSYTKNLEQLEILVNSPQPPNYVVTLPSTINVTPALPPRGASQVYKVKLIGPGAVAYAEVCYTLSAIFEHDDCPWCCYIENCIKLPICSCAEVLLDSVYCSGNGYAYKFKLQNRTQYDVTKIQLSSPGSIPVTFVPQTFNFGTPIEPEQLFPTLTAQMIGGAAGQTIPVRIKLFSNDFECCYFELSYTLPPCDTLFMHLKSFIEGRYDPVTNSMVGDNIEVELRNNYPPYALVETAAGYLSSTGTSLLEFYNAVNGVNYYIVLKNSSTLETWSKSPGQSFSSDVLNFDFLTDTQAYGANLELIDSTPLYFGILSGDVNQDGAIDLFDVVMIYNDASAFITGNSDLNGDGVTDLSDIMISNNNALNFESVIRP